MRRIAVLGLLFAAGCFAERTDFGNGDLLCETGTNACPPGYGCAQGRCFKIGQEPVVSDAAVTGCSAEERRCDGRNQQQCQAGSFATVGTCDKACLSGFCVECVPGNLRCDDNQPQKCNGSGGWSNEPSCAPPTQQCQAGVCGAGCTPSTRRCAPGDGAAVQACDQAGIFRTVETCAFVCAGGSCGGECRPGAKRCGPDQTPQTCSTGGAWVNGTACPGVCVGDGTCAGECRPGSTRCTAQNQLQTCDGAGAWGAGAACTFVCVAGQTNCSGECTPGLKRCSGATVQQCGADGRWADQTSCAPGACTLGECRPCSDGEKQCNAGIPQLCGGGQWGNTQPSPCAFICSDGVCGGECVPGSYTCQGSVSRSCGSDGKYKNETCAFVCLAATGQCGGSCKPDSKRCSGDVAQTCAATGEWSAGTTCGFGCDAASGSCNACVPEDLTVTCANGGCGEKTNNCGAKVTCPICPNPRDSCGGGGVAGVCGCTPVANPCAGHCGSADNGCQTVTCPACADGGGGSPDAAIPDAPLPPDAAVPDGPLPPDAAVPDAPLVDARPADARPPDAALLDAGGDACVNQPNPCLNKCGLVPLLCGGSIACGGCDTGETCDANFCRCETQDEACGHTNCGFAPRCGGRFWSCWQFTPPACPDFTSCTREPGICKDCDLEDPCKARECGPTTDNCGRMVECGVCKPGLACAGTIDDAKCVDISSCEKCQASGFKNCCFHPGGFSLYCTSDECPLGDKDDPLDDYALHGTAGCEKDPTPCATQECGPVMDACGNMVECGDCEPRGGNICYEKFDLQSVNVCDSVLNDPCKNCCNNGGLCCERPGYTPFCADPKVTRECPADYTTVCKP